MRDHPDPDRPRRHDLAVDGVNPADVPATAEADTAALDDVQIVVAHRARVTLRVGDVFLKVDPHQARIDVEVAAMGLVPVPTPPILWRRPPVLALAAVPGTALGRLGEQSTAGPAGWAAAGAAVRALHDTPLPPWSGESPDVLAAQLDIECAWLLANDVVPADVVARNRRMAAGALAAWTPVFAHGDLQVCHVFVEGDRVTGIIDWSEAGPGDARYDLAVLTMGHPEHVGDVLAGYGGDVDRDLIRGWWSFRCLVAVRWLVEHDYGRADELPEVSLLLSTPAGGGTP
jgi:aminoglycoside phosphotransferase (APT) family kinase protein